MKPARTALLVMLAFAATTLLAQTDAPSYKGKYERIKVHGKSLEGNLSGDSADRDVSIYLPPGYSKNTKRRYPVVYLLHGFTDSDDRWFGLIKHFVNVPEAADKAFAAGVPEMIIVMPNAYTTFAGSMYSNSVTTGDWEGYISQDLVAYVDSRYRTIPNRNSRGLAGHSMGGYGTVRLSFKSSGVFSSVYAMSPCCMGADISPRPDMGKQIEAIKTLQDVEKANFGVKAMLASAAAWSPNPKNPPFFFDFTVKDGQLQPDVIASWAANAPLAMVHQYIPALKKYKAIAMDAGDKDMGINNTVKALDQILTDYGVPHTSEIYEGDHVNRIAERLVTKVLPFFGANLSFTGKKK
ncbi:MAG TPA: alpha/beta hydrolase-fold protein [Acidobacteriota bacterium]|nr:alpha/beta hydrolase-fold protein [Acidobacteriota bacterium]